MSTATKRPYAEALYEAEHFRALFSPKSYERWEFGGSLRRRKPDIADIEHVVIPAFGDVMKGDGLFTIPTRGNLLWEELDAYVRDGKLRKHWYGNGNRYGEKYRGVDYNGFNNEIFCTTVDQWGGTFLIRTGPADFSTGVVDRLKRGGIFRQQDGQLIHVASGQPVSVPDERTYLTYAGIRWVEPEQR